MQHEHTEMESWAHELHEVIVMIDDEIMSYFDAMNATRSIYNGLVIKYGESEVNDIKQSLENAHAKMFEKFARGE